MKTNQNRQYAITRSGRAFCPKLPDSITSADLPKIISMLNCRYSCPGQEIALNEIADGPFGVAAIVNRDRASTVLYSEVTAQSSPKSKN